MTRHVVLGAGPVGAALASALTADPEHEVVIVSRSGRAVPRARAVALDVTVGEGVRAVCAGADVVYFALNPPDYGRWPEQFPPLQRAVLDGARHAGAKLVAVDNLYALPADGRVLREDTPMEATGSKGRTRAAMARELLAVDDIPVVVGRASDFFGPGVTASAFGDLVVPAALRGGRVRVLGDPDLPHSYSYVPDLGRALAALAGSDATGLWNLPVAETVSTRRLVGLGWDAAGARRRRLSGAGRTTLTLVGLVRPAVRAYLETLPRFQHPWVVDDGRFRDRFPTFALTALVEAVRNTVASFRAKATSVR